MNVLHYYLQLKYTHLSEQLIFDLMILRKATHGCCELHPLTLILIDAEWQDSQV